jgi:hypothetical protein
MISLYIDESDCDILTGSGREPAICELRCDNCDDGLKFDAPRCVRCGKPNPRFATGPSMAMELFRANNRN